MTEDDAVRSEQLQRAEELDELAGRAWVEDRIDDAQEHYRDALSIREQILGPDSIEVADSLARLAAMVGWRGKNTVEEEALTKRALGIFEIHYRQLAGSHIFMGMQGELGNLAGLCLRQNRLAEAEAYVRRSQTIIRETCGEKAWIHPSLATFAEILMRLDQDAEAEQMLLKALEKPAQPDTTDETTRIDCRSTLATLFITQGRYTEAKREIDAALSEYQTVSRPNPFSLIAVLEHRLRLFQLTDRHSEIPEIEARLQQLRTDNPLPD
jgi:tetratricopeptide (TPR) repeat protein